MKLDTLIFAAHPDDAELGMGGTIAKMTSENLKVGIIDLTKGEMGTRGTVETRQTEAFKAASILKLTVRENLHVKDGEISDTKDNLMKIIISIRKYRPRFIFAPYFNDRHPDHVALSALVKKAYFFTGLAKIKTFEKDTAQEAFRPSRLFYYMQTYAFDPNYIVDISGTFETKMKSVNAYSSQFYNPESKEPETFISQPRFFGYIEARARVYGFQIGKDFGEPFFCEEALPFDIVSALTEAESPLHRKDEPKLL